MKRLCLREAARMAVLSRGCRGFYRSRLSQEQARLLGLLGRGLGRSITGPQIRFLLRFIQDAVRGCLFREHWETTSLAGIRNKKQKICVDPTGRRLAGRSGSGCLEVRLEWHMSEKFGEAGQLDGQARETRPHCAILTPGGYLIGIHWGQFHEKYVWGGYDRLPTDLAEVSIDFRDYRIVGVNDDDELVRALLLCTSLFILEKGFKARRTVWDVVPSDCAQQGRQRGKDADNAPCAVYIERAPRVVAVELSAVKGKGAEELSVLAGMQGLVEGAQARGYFHVGPNGVPRPSCNTYREGVPSIEIPWSANLQRRSIRERITQPGTGAVFLVRVKTDTDGGLEAEGVIPWPEEQIVN